MNSIKSLSIITVNLDDKSGLSRTVESVKSQNFQDFEFIIIDGGSKDGSLEVIKENETLIDYWVSEKDSGIYNAMNKGIKRATGKYILFLNSGDYLIDENAFDYDFSNEGYDILFGHHTTTTVDGTVRINTYEDRNIDLGFFVVSTLPHCSTFIKKSLFDLLGYYDVSYKICADWVFFFRAVIFERASIIRLERPIGVFELGGISTDKSNIEIVKSERERFLNSVLDKSSITYIRQTYPLFKEYYYLKKELENQKKEADEYYSKISNLKGIGLLMRFKKFFKL